MSDTVVIQCNSWLNKINKTILVSIFVKNNRYQLKCYRNFNHSTNSEKCLIKLEKALKQSCFKAFIWWSIAGSNR